MRLVSPEPWATALASAGDAALTPLGGNAYEVRTVFPSSVYLMKQAPKPVTLPCDLTGVPFIPSFVSQQGVQLNSPQYAGAGVGEGAVGGVSKRGFNAHPPDHGRTIQDFPLTLPPGPCKFHCSIGLRDGSKSEGCLFIVAVTGNELARQLILPGAWHEFEARYEKHFGPLAMARLR